MQNESTKKTIVVALAVCLVCSVLVSATAIGLKARQQENQRLEKLRNILIAGGIETAGGDVDALYREKIESMQIDLAKGTVSASMENVDLKVALKKAVLHEALSPEKDLAGIRVRPRTLSIYSVREGDAVTRWILPIAGKGLWSTMYGFIALDADLKTVRGLTFYEHGETPGLGGEIDNPQWKAQWNGKMVFDEAGSLKLQVIKGKVDLSSPQSKYQIDGLSGSTLTTRGVDMTIQFWLGSNGYGPWLDKKRGDG
ncbi:Na(+)-translocating NADH-quinone reductase subunit C [bacterium]|nr:Na(+)-translocating NADH-quinone reductase subunit C [bacterium]